MKKFIVVIGESGVGKSTIVNMLYNQDWSESCCLGPCATGSTAASITKASALHVNLSSCWCFVDTVGVGDPELSVSELTGAIRSLVRHTARGVHAVICVVKMERVPHASRANIELLREVFREDDLKSHGVLVLTHWSGDELADQEKDLAAWIGSDQVIRQVVESFGKVVLTNNTLQKRGAFPEAREKCLKELVAFVDERETRVNIKPLNIYELVSRLVEEFANKLWGRIVSLKDLVRTGEGSPLPTFCGECSVCLEQIELAHARKLFCGHGFHCHCLPSNRSCPLCRATYEEGEWFSFV